MPAAAHRLSLLERVAATLDGAGVTADLDDLPARCRRLWQRIVEDSPD